MAIVRRSLHYPDLVPPAGWTYFPQGTQIRLIPAGAPPDAAPTIIVSPLVPVVPALPPPERLIARAIDAEARVRLDVLERGEPTPARAASGLSGVRVTLAGAVRPGGARERRVYVVLADSLCYYGVSYRAAEAELDAHLPSFDAVVRSIRPFAGRAVPPVEAAPFALYSD